MLKFLIPFLVTTFVVPFLRYRGHGDAANAITFFKPLFPLIGEHIDKKLAERKQRQLPPKSDSS